MEAEAEAEVKKYFEMEAEAEAVKKFGASTPTDGRTDGQSLL